MLVKRPSIDENEAFRRLQRPGQRPQPQARRGRPDDPHRRAFQPPRRTSGEGLGSHQPLPSRRGGSGRPGGASVGPALRGRAQPGPQGGRRRPSGSGSACTRSSGRRAAPVSSSRRSIRNRASPGRSSAAA
ncbi:MAG: hypothetical protein U0835_15260 [Isosphaeraceae bacterium]